MNGASSVGAAAEVVVRHSAAPLAEVRPADARAAHPLDDRADGAGPADATALPPSVDLRGVFSKTAALPYDQSSLSSCTANAVAAAIEYQVLSNPSMSNLVARDYFPSRLFLYYNGRFLGGHDVNKDDGVSIWNAIRTAAIQGVTSEGPAAGTSNGATWPYVTENLRHAANPGAANYLAAREVRATGYTQVAGGVDGIKSALAARRPVVLGIETYKNFPSEEKDWPRPSPGAADATPTIPLPQGKQDGGHAILAVGYDDARQAFLILNSWGKEWGANGYAYLPYAYVENTKWTNPNDSYSIDGVTQVGPPATIGGLDDLTSRNHMDEVQGQVHIDTALASSSGTATSFDFFQKPSPGRAVTPLLFSYDAQTATYTLTGIGRTYDAGGSGAQGVPFDAVEGSNAVGTETAFGFVDGRVKIVDGDARIVPTAGTIPFSTTTAGTAATWLTSIEPRAATKAQSLAIGQTFSATVGAQMTLTSTARPRFYSAMLVE